MGFLQDGALRSKGVVKTSRCGACGLATRCATPKMKPVGNGQKEILIVLPPVTDEEDQAGKVMGHTQGRWLTQMLQRQGIDPARDCWVTSALICHSPKYDNVNVDHCRYMLEKFVDEVQPQTIIAMGDEATRSVIAMSSNLVVKTAERWIGWQIPSQKYNAWICPTHSYFGEKEDSLVLRRTKAHILAALKHDRRPWDVVPDWIGQIRILSETQAVKFLKRLNKSGEPFSLDYETTTLKPEGSASKIASAAITVRGKVTVAFAWNRPVAAALRPVVMNKAGKVAANCKFEDRWTRNKLNTPVRNWVWDTMQAAHCLDNRMSTTSLDYNAFVLLGFPNYAMDIKMYLGSDFSYTPNQIHQIPLKDLLLYNGLDTLLEWKIAIKQMEMMGHPALERLMP